MWMVFTPDSIEKKISLLYNSLHIFLLRYSLFTANDLNKPSSLKISIPMHHIIELSALATMKDFNFSSLISS